MVAVLLMSLLTGNLHAVDLAQILGSYSEDSDRACDRPDETQKLIISSSSVVIKYHLRGGDDIVTYLVMKTSNMENGVAFYWRVATGAGPIGKERVEKEFINVFVFEFLENKDIAMKGWYVLRTANIAELKDLRSIPEDWTRANKSEKIYYRCY